MLPGVEPENLLTKLYLSPSRPILLITRSIRNRTHSFKNYFIYCGFIHYIIIAIVILIFIFTKVQKIGRSLACTVPLSSPKAVITAVVVIVIVVPAVVQEARNITFIFVGIKTTVL
jgi:hypothetical protein